MDNKIEEIMNVLNDIEYGFKDQEGNNIIDNKDKWDNEFDRFYYLQEPEELLNTKCGVCWDQVELERHLLSKYNIPIKTYFIYFNHDGMLPSHTFLVYEKDNKYYWFEHSWYRERGIHEYTTMEELLDDVQKKFMKDYQNTDGILYIYEYKKPKRHIKCMEFYDYISTQKLIKKEVIKCQ